MTARLASIVTNLAALLAARGDTAGADDEHDPEGATASGEWSRLAGLRVEAVAELAALDEAQARLDAGVYGVCTDCGAAIPVARLEALPAATRCVSCAARHR
ncbi:MAG: TraR/DksA C4-type zinc finger protein [Microbacterium sp.]